jgi:3-deoxy-D-manno-octulosonic-acid transferase
LAERLPLSLRSYRQLASMATPLTSAVLANRLKHGKEHPQRVGERRGETEVQRPDGALIWAHGASVGEMLAIMPLVAYMQGSGFNVLMTSGTLTSARLAEQRLPPGVIHQFVPIDAPRFIARFLSHWRPNLGLFAEQDLWPNLILGSAGRNIPLIVINGRLSAQSFSRWRYAPSTIAALLGRFELCLAQSAVDAQRYAELGATRVRITGNLKLDVPAPPVDPQQLAVMRASTARRPVIAASSTHPGEEGLVIDAHRGLQNRFEGLLTVLVPRHPERGSAIVNLARAAGLRAVLRSRGHLPDRETDVYVADTIGELGLWYRLSPIVFIGGSLIRHGGQNPIEAAKLGAAIVHGPHVWNFGEIYAALDATQGAERVTDGGELTRRLGAWLTAPAERRSVSEEAKKTIDLLSGALDRTLEALEPYLMQLRRGQW